MVVLTARDETRGLEAVEKLNASGLSDQVVFHLLDVMDPASIASLADFIRSQYGKLDILNIPDEWAKGVFSDVDTFTEERIDELLSFTVSLWSVKTDMSNNTGTSSVDEAAVYPVKLALLPVGGPSGFFFILDKLTLLNGK
ncbi:(+)-neomenthol dehydrogenase-like [Populus alba]|uniref:(+)-neomenthol dehydrogenase-like n=1 Tax=Populus alba TaxID=43335 RepID=A0A4U5Q7C3_POPAL|nr:hypothetical protein D5086_0000124800 [Populus alba]